APSSLAVATRRSSRADSDISAGSDPESVVAAALPDVVDCATDCDSGGVMRGNRNRVRPITAAAAAANGQRGRCRFAARWAASTGQALVAGASSGSAANAWAIGMSCSRERRSAMDGYLGIDLQLQAQLAGAAGELRFGKGNGLAHRRGDLVVGETFRVVEPEHAAGDIGQRVQGPRH